MKKVRFLIIIFCLIRITGFAQNWIPVGDSNFAIGAYTSLAIDNNGSLYLAFDSSSGNAFDPGKATVMKCNDNSWELLGNGDFSPYNITYIFIAVDNSNNPYVAFDDLFEGTSVLPGVMKYTYNNWFSVGDSVDIDSAETTFISIALNNIGVPYVLFEDGGYQHKATVKKFDGTNWVTVGNPGFSTGAAFYTSIAVDKDGLPYVAYEDVDSGEIYGPATIMRYDGNNWINVGIPHFSAGNAWFTNIALDTNGIPYLIYQDWANEKKATVMKYVDSTWINVGNPGFSEGEAAFTSIAFDKKTNMPYVAYQDSINDYKAAVMKFDGTGWQTVGKPDFSAGLSKFLSLAIAPDGTPYVAYTNGVNFGYITVMKYVTDTTGINNIATQNDLTISPNPSAGIFHISFAKKITAVQVFDVQGRLIMENNSGPINNNKTVINLGGKAKGIYFLRATTADGMINGKLVVE